MTRGGGSVCGAHPEGVVITQMQYYLCSRERELRWRGTQGLLPSMTDFADWGSSCLSFPHRQVQAYITIRDPRRGFVSFRLKGGNS